MRHILWAIFVICHCHVSAETIEKEGIRYFVVKCDPQKVRIVWRDPEGRQIRDFPAAKSFLESQGEKPWLLMNGGIFEPGGIPSGLLVQSGEELCPVNRKEGAGNFFLKPNGIFLIGRQGARVVDAGAFPLNNEVVRFAVQSGPILLINGKTHPAFNKGSDSRLLRNGVGVMKDGRVIFAISDRKGTKSPNLYEFADFFRSQGCSDALFLDGDISQMRFGAEMSRPSNQFGSIIAVVE
ncbi:phosphodiester glycosidase family protein [Luteolibacter algae]|uniref:Phosphodiester glycosidase family protein n=1 Tax=Luteolibacter algae TaxID=454151 RepID=A0ABW5D2S9_9BACT